MEAFLGDLQAIGEQIADKPKPRILAFKSLEFARLVAANAAGFSYPRDLAAGVVTTAVGSSAICAPSVNVTSLGAGTADAAIRRR